MDNNKQIIRLTEQDLSRMVEEAIYNLVLENEENEGLWNQLKQGTKSFFGNGYGKDRVNKNGELTNYRNSVRNRQERGDWTANRLNGSTPLNLGKRIKSAVTGFKEQGNVDNANEVMNMLKGLVNDGAITLDMTVKQVLNKMMGKRLGAQNRVSKANNDIYKGMTTGVMGSGKFDLVK